MRQRILLAAAFAYLAVSNLIWISRDTRPPFWDMALHSLAALRIYDSVAASGFAAVASIPRNLLSTSYPYPPLYQSILAAAWALFGRTIDVAQLANLGALALLLLATYGIGRSVLSPFSAALAGVLACSYPYMLWLSRETVIDYWLAAIVAVAIWVLLKSDHLSRPAWAALFGIIAGLGMLTKWTFVFFLALPFLWLARKHFRNAAIPIAIASVISAWWYIPAIPVLKTFFGLNTAGGVAEGDPGRLTWQAGIFYIRALESYQLFLPLTIAFAAGLVLLLVRRNSQWTPIVLWIAGGWMGLMLFQNKDPRYSAPLLPAVALITCLAFEKRRILSGVLLGFLAIQHYAVSFGIQAIPDSVVLAEGIQGPLSWDWSLYRQTYFGLWGKPKREDWRLDHVISVVSGASNQPVRLGLVPDIPRFDATAFQFAIAFNRKSVQLNRITVPDEHTILANDFILVSEGRQGFYPADAAALKPVNDYVLGHPEHFQQTEGFALPDGSFIRLYRVQ